MTGPATAGAPPAPRPTPSLRRTLLRRPAAVSALAVLALIVLACVAAPLVAPWGVNQSDLSASLQGPSLSHLLGTDELGRDTLSRLLHGGRVSLFYAAIVAAVALAVGVSVGLLSGYLGGWTDRVIMLVTDVGMAIPVLVVVIVVLSVFRDQFVVAMVALGLLVTPPIVRAVRASVLAVRNELFVDAARVSGLSSSRILLRHVLPRVAGPVLVQAALASVLALQFSVGLAYLGFGPQPPNPTWGSMIADGAQVLPTNGWLLLASGSVVAMVTICLGLLGDVVRDAAVASWAGGAPAARRHERPSGRLTALPPPAAGRVPPGLLTVDGLSIAVDLHGRQTLVASDVSFSIAAGQTVGLVGESGCGKTSVARAILRLQSAGTEVVAGDVRFDDRSVLGLSRRELADYRGKSVGYIPQDPIASLDPTMRVGTLLAQVVRIHAGLSRVAARERVIELLETVHLPDPAGVARKFPHQLSGGMAQRVAIARAIATGPALLIADEPTTALDVTVQAKILELLRELQQRMGMAVLLVSHDWAVIAQTCQQAIVMYAGQVVERGPVDELLTAPAHPYTEALLACRPADLTDLHRLPVISGQVPAPGAWPAGCRFGDRCEYRLPACGSHPIAVEPVGAGHTSRCLRTQELSATAGGGTHDA